MVYRFLGLKPFSFRKYMASAARLAVTMGSLALCLGWWVVSPVSGACPELVHRGLDRPPIPKGLEVDPPFDTRDACPAWRWIGLQEDIETSCPQPEAVNGVSWQVRSLFESDSPHGVPAVLRPFCVYELETGDSPVEQEIRDGISERLEDVVLSGALREVWSSCAAVGPMAESSNMAGARNEDWAALRDNFLAQAQQLQGGWISSSSLAGSNADQEFGSVRLAILDTQPDTSVIGNSDHGYALAQMAKELIYPCGQGADGSCERPAGPVRIENRLALPIEKFDWNDPSVSRFNFEQGGYFGTVDQLAEALWQEIRGQEIQGQEAPAGSGRVSNRLVINLSVAWVGEHFGGLEDRVSRMPASVQSLFRVLEVAACRDGLVIAATGNRVGGPDLESGPLMPASWHRRRAPRADECSAILGRAGHEGKRSSHSFRDDLTDKLLEDDQPLVYAVGGVRYEGLPLINARPHSESSMVGYSDHSVILATRGEPEDALPSILTGTSIGTTVVSTAAAAAWSLLPDLSPHELMSLVESTGEPLGRDAAVFLKSPSTVKRIGVCPVFARALAIKERQAVALDCASPPSPVALVGSADNTPFSLAFDQQQEGIELCQVTSFSTDGSPIQNPCPFHQFYGIRSRPWTGPQPANNPCMGCDIRPPPPGFQGAENTWSLRIQIDPEWQGGAVYDPILQLGKVGHTLDICREVPDASRCPKKRIEGKRELCCSLLPGEELWVGGIPAATVWPQDRLRPEAAIFFETREGSIESPVYISSKPMGSK